MSTEAKNMAAWLEECLFREYTLERVLSQKPSGEITLWRNKEMERRIILRRCTAFLTSEEADE